MGWAVLRSLSMLKVKLEQRIYDVKTGMNFFSVGSLVPDK